MSTLLTTQQQFSHNVGKLLFFLYDHGYTCTLAEAYRSPEQAAIYASEGKGIADSQHCKRLAIDINLFDSHNNMLTTKEQFQSLGIFWESLGNNCRWGGRFEHLVDSNHFEMQEPK